MSIIPESRRMEAHLQAKGLGNTEVNHTRVKKKEAEG
jgi:hypothetical protein